MTQLIPTQFETNFALTTQAESPIGRTRLCLRLLLLIPVSLAKGMIALSGVIGSAAMMAYVDPYMPKGKDRK